MSTNDAAHLEPVVALTTLECVVCHTPREHFGVTACSKPLDRGGHEPNVCFNCWTRHLTNSNVCPLCRAAVELVYDVTGDQLMAACATFVTCRQAMQSGPGPERTDRSPSFRVFMRQTPNHVIVAGMGVGPAQTVVDVSPVLRNRVVVDVEVASSSDEEGEVPRRDGERVAPYFVMEDTTRVRRRAARFPGHTLRQLNTLGVRVSRTVVDDIALEESESQTAAYRALARHCVYATVWEQGRAAGTSLCGLSIGHLLRANFMVTSNGLCKSCLFPVGVHPPDAALVPS